MSQRSTYDVAVVGGGNAGLSAALAARQAGASVIVLEASPRDFRGGNSRHTRNLRCAHAAPTDVLTESYSEDEFLADLMRVTNNEADGPLARLLVDLSASCPAVDGAVRRAIPAVAQRHASLCRERTRSSWAAARRS